MKKLYKYMTTDINHITIPKNCKIIIFDLDETLHNKNFILESHIVDILQLLKNNSIVITLASLNKTACFYLYFYNILDFFDHIEQKSFSDEYIQQQSPYHNKFSKIEMYQKIANKFKINYENILVFDDNPFHCLEANKLKIKYIKIRQNYILQWSDLKKGLQLFNHNHNHFKRYSL